MAASLKTISVMPENVLDTWLSEHSRLKSANQQLRFSVRSTTMTKYYTGASVSGAYVINVDVCDIQYSSKFQLLRSRSRLPNIREDHGRRDHENPRLFMHGGVESWTIPKYGEARKHGRETTREIRTAPLLSFDSISSLHKRSEVYYALLYANIIEKPSRLVKIQDLDRASYIFVEKENML